MLGALSKPGGGVMAETPTIGSVKKNTPKTRILVDLMSRSSISLSNSSTRDLIYLDLCSLPCRKPCDLLSDLFFSQANLVGTLQIQPKLRVGAEPVAEPQRGVAGDTPAAVNDLRHTIGRDVDLSRKLGRGNAKFAQFIGKDFAGMDCGTGHDACVFQ